MILDKFHFPKNSPQRIDQIRHSEPYSIAIIPTRNQSQKHYLYQIFHEIDQRRHSEPYSEAIFTAQNKSKRHYLLPDFSRVFHELLLI